MQLIDQLSAAQFIRAMAPDWAWLLQHIESEDGYVRFPPQFSHIIVNLKIENYPELYENELFIAAMMLRAFLEPEEIKELEAKLISLSLEERSRFVAEKFADLNAFGEAIEIPKTPDQQKRAEAVFNALPKEEQTEVTQFWQHFMMAFLASFHQSLSVMVHGEKLTSLVSQAKAGNDKAFAKAVQIDKRILLAIPYFKRKRAANPS